MERNWSLKVYVGCKAITSSWEPGPPQGAYMAPAGTGRLPSLSSTFPLYCTPCASSIDIAIYLRLVCVLRLIIPWVLDFLHGLHFQVSCSEFLRCTSPQHHLLNHFLHPHFNHLL